MKTITCSVLSLLAGYAIGNHLTDHRRQSAIPVPPVSDTTRVTKTDTVLMRDTLRITVPAPAQEHNLPDRLVTVPSHILSATKSADSVAIAAVTRIYTDDSTYRAVVSGVHPRLDTLAIYPPRTLITGTTSTLIRTVEPACAPFVSSTGPPSSILHTSHTTGLSRWGLGVTAGVAVTPHGLTPALTLGLTYRLWP